MNPSSESIFEAVAARKVNPETAANYLQAHYGKKLTSAEFGLTFIYVLISAFIFYQEGKSIWIISFFVPFVYLNTALESRKSRFDQAKAKLLEEWIK